MSVPNYTYFVTIGAVETQVYPHGDWSLKMTEAKEDFPFCKDYRIKFEGDFIFSGDDYDLLRDAGCCDKIDLKIKCDGENYWFGYFAYPYDLEVDEDRCTLTGTPKPLDKYYYFDLNADTKVQLTHSDTVTYQDNFDSAHANDPPNDTWPDDCIDCEPIWDIVSKIGTNFPLEPGGFIFTVKSSFFNNDTYPDGTIVAPNNYVTGFTNKLIHVVMALALEINTLGVTPGEWPEWSWNDLMVILYNKFNTWWYIDENGEIRIEHIYFWELYFGTSYDLTTIDGGRWIVNSSKYDYRIEEMPKQEYWIHKEILIGNWMTPRIYYTDCFLPGTSTYIKEYLSPEFTSDIEYIAPGTDNLATTVATADIDDGDYMFLRCITRAEAAGLGYGTGDPIPDCDYVCWWSRVVRTGNDHLNAHLSPGNLIVNFWMHDRPFWSGYFNVEIDDINFESTWKTLRQIELCFPVCCEECSPILEGNIGTDPRYLYQFGIDFNENITTQYGAGELYTGTIKDGTLCLQLIFEDLDCEESATEWSNASEL